MDDRFNMDFEQILKEVGPFGRYQKIVISILSHPLLLTTLQLFVQVFTAGKSDHWCLTWPQETCEDHRLSEMDCAIIKRNVSIPFKIESDFEAVFDQCDKYNVTGIEFETAWHETDGFNANEISNAIPCGDDGWFYDTSVFPSTVIIDFDLVCGKSFLPNIAQSAYFAGFLVGSLLAGPVADLIGRRMVLLVTTLLTGVAGLAVCFSVNMWMFIVLRFLTAAFAIVTMIYSVILSNEIVEASKRIVAANVLCIMFAVGYIVLSGLAKVIKTWRMLQLAVSLPYFVVLILLYFFVPESPLWLVSKGRHTEAEKVLRNMAKINGKELGNDFMTSNVHYGEKTDKRSFMALFLNLRFTLVVINVCLIWMIHSFAYYGLSLSTSTLGIDPYISFLVSGAIEIPAYVLCMFVPELFGRKPSAVVILSLGGGTCCLTALFSPGVFRALLAMLGKSLVTMSFALVVCWGMEIVPTSLRGSAYGLFSACSRIGGIIAPLFLILEDVWYNLPVIMFGTVTIFAAFLCLFLPETRGVPLPTTVQDIEKLHKLNVIAKVTDDAVNNNPGGYDEKRTTVADNHSYEKDAI